MKTTDAQNKPGRGAEPVTVLVLCYNSSKTVVETLDSIRDQSYGPLELVVADDCSADDTVALARKWIAKSRKRFTAASVACMKKNEGIPFNLNNGMRRATSRWVKLIAGDDLLLPSCVADNMDFVAASGGEVSFLYSKLRSFRTAEGRMVFLEFSEEEYRYMRTLAALDSAGQYRLLLKKDILLSPTTFMLAEAFWKIGGADESVPLIDDWPMRLRLTRMGYRIDFMEKVTVLRRMHDSVSQSSTTFYRESHIKSMRKLRRELCYPDIPWYDVPYYLNEAMAYLRETVIIGLLGNRKGFLPMLVHKASYVFSANVWKKTLRKIAGR